MLSPGQLSEIQAIIDNTQTSKPGFNRPDDIPKLDITKGNSVATRKVGGKTGPKMPGLGRTEEQIKSYVESEASRTIELDAEAEDKAIRREERERKKQEKTEAENAKKEAEKKELEEIEKIKKANEAHEKKVITKPLRKPWEPEK